MANRVKKKEFLPYYYFNHQNEKNSLYTLSIIDFIHCLCPENLYLGGTLTDGIFNELKKNLRIVVEKNKIVATEAGKLADIIAVGGDPLKDTTVFGKVVFVMKDGVLYK